MICEEEQERTQWGEEDAKRKETGIYLRSMRKKRSTDSGGGILRGLGLPAVPREIRRPLSPDVPVLPDQQDCLVEDSVRRRSDREAERKG